MAATSRRGAMKMNSVTGKMERMTEADLAVPAGKVRDGALLVDERYINAAKDLGLGGGEKGMYGHIKALTRMGKGAADVPDAPSLQRER